MTGERVVALKYALDLEASVQYRETARRAVTLKGFKGELTAQGATFIPTEHCGSVAEGRALLDPQLHAWRTWVRVQTGTDCLPFRFERADREAWPPPPPGSFVVLANSCALEITGHRAQVTLTRNEFPDLPPPFAIDDLVAVGLVLYEDARQIPRHTLKFAFAYLMLLQQAHDGRRNLALDLNFDERVLGDMASLCTDGGDELEARTFKWGAQRIPLTEPRREWLMHVFRELLARQGQFAANAVPSGKFPERRP